MREEVDKFIAERKAAKNQRPVRPVMGQYKTHVFVCTSATRVRLRATSKQFVKYLRDEATKAGLKTDVRVNKAGCFSQCGHGPMMVVLPGQTFWYGWLLSPCVACVAPGVRSVLLCRSVLSVGLVLLRGCLFFAPAFAL